MSEANTITVKGVELLFQFENFSQWLNTSASLFGRYGLKPDWKICLDAKDRVCKIGKHFMRARDEDTFPVRVYALVPEKTSMKLHPRTMKVQAASCAISKAITDAIESLDDDDLTYLELLRCLTEIQARWIKYALREERHPGDTDKRADEE